MKKEDQMIDSLIKEHAKSGAGDDVDFLTDLEKRLDEEQVVISMTSSDSKKKTRRGLSAGIGIAAALTVVAVGYYGWKDDGSVDLAINNSTQAGEQIADMEVQIGNTANAEVNLAKKKEAPSKGQEVAFAEVEETPGGNLASPTTQDFVEAKADVAPPTAVFPNAPKVIASNTTSNIAIPRTFAQRAEPIEGGVLDNSFDEGWSDIGGERQLRSKAKPSTRKELRFDRRRQSRNRYNDLIDNTFLSPWKAPLSTFSVDVDTASYTNMRSMIQGGQTVPKDAVRIEEMVNYFNYDYPQPKADHPFSVNVETASCPWNAERRLVKIGLQGKEILSKQRPAANLVFLLDVSGSMNNQNKLPLLVDSMKILLKELNGDDSVSIVVYAGAQGLALPPTLVNEEGRKTILDKLNNFQSGGSTDGGSGITLAYKMAKENFIKGGVNRVILGTDGDFNVGTTDSAALVSMVEREAKSGVFLSVLGLGQGNLNDAMLEDITNKGNGNYAYIDSLREGRKVFLDDMMGNIVTIAKDVKIQVEFNPAKVKSYRLIGYANRMLKAEDFKNKRVDAGEIGAGHTVTALYEIVPGNAQESAPVVDDLEYQTRSEAPKKVELRDAVDSPNMLTVKLAYKGPEATKETESTYFNTRVKDTGTEWESASDDFKFASSVALFGMLQRGSDHSGQGSYKLVRELAEQGRGEDFKGHRTEFSDLVRKAAGTSGKSR